MSRFSDQELTGLMAKCSERFPFWAEGGTAQVAALRFEIASGVWICSPEKRAHYESRGADGKDYIPDYFPTWYSTEPAALCDAAHFIARLTFNPGIIPTHMTDGVVDAFFNMAVIRACRCKPQSTTDLWADARSDVNFRSPYAAICYFGRLFVQWEFATNALASENTPPCTAAQDALIEAVRSYQWTAA